MKDIDEKFLVIGLGISGRAAARFLLKRGAFVVAVDRDRELLEKHTEVALLKERGLKAFHESESIDLSSFDRVVVSPGVPQTNFYYKKARELGLKVIGEVELACQFIKQRFLGITGTNGKTTVTLLVTHVLNQSGFKAKALGNSGVPLTTELLEETDPSTIIVGELSSYQLETLEAKVLDAAAILNVTPDHLDRYQTMEAYAQAKFHIKDCLKAGGVLVIEEKCFAEYGYLLEQFPVETYGYHPKQSIYSDLTHMIVHEDKIEMPFSYQGRKSHEIENLMAAYALCAKVGVTLEQFFRALASFKKPAHRIEFVRQYQQVNFYDDSKGTNIDAVIRAVESLKGDIVLIGGGVDKGASYKPWIPIFHGRVTCVCAIGQAAEKIKKDLSPSIPVEFFSGLDKAVEHAVKVAKPGMNVLLSPGCSSFDMFRDYAHRGDEFKKIVNYLGL